MRRTKSEDEALKLMARSMASVCVRDTFLEDLHAGTFPESKVGDYSDVKVIDGMGQEIPWTELSRLSDKEMKKLMKQVVNLIYSYSRCTDNPEFQSYITLSEHEARNWDEPELIWESKNASRQSA